MRRIVIAGIVATLFLEGMIMLACLSAFAPPTTLSLSNTAVTLVREQSNYPLLVESVHPPSGIPWTWTASGFSGFSPTANIWFTYENDGVGQPNENHTEAYLHWSGFLDSEWENGNSGSFTLTLSNGVDSDIVYEVLLSLRCLVADGYTVIKQQVSGGDMINDAGEEGFVFTPSGFSGFAPAPTVTFNSMGGVTSCSCANWNQAGKFTLTIQDGTRPASVITGMNLTLGQLDSTIFTIARNQQSKAHIINNGPADGAYHWSGNAGSDFRTVDGQPPAISFSYDGGDTRRGIINVTGVHDDDWAEEVSGAFTLSLKDGNRPESIFNAVLNLRNAGSPWETEFIEPDGYPIVDFASYDGKLYAASGNKLYVHDSYSWNIINAPTFVTSLEPYQGILIVGGRGGLYCYNGTSFSLIFSVPTYIKVLGVYNNTLYAGTFLANPPILYYCNGSIDNPNNWHIDTDFSISLNFSGPFGSIDSFAVRDDVMYVGSGGTLYSFSGTEWSVAASYEDVCAFLDMQVYNSRLYLATRDQGWRKPLYQGGTGFSGRVLEFDGENWTTLLDHDYWIYSLGVYNGKLYAGTANRILTYNGTTWAVSFNAEEEAYYALCFENYDGKIYVGMGNGYIFADPIYETADLLDPPPTITVPEFPSIAFLISLIISSLPAIALVKRRLHRKP